jgi:hypothetical protein
MVVIVTESIQEKNNLDLVEIDRPHIGDSRVHCEDFIGAVTEGHVAAIAEVKGLLEQKELGVRAEFLVALLEFREDEMRSGEMGHGIIIRFGDAPVDETSKGAVVCLPDVVRLRVEGGVWLRERPFQPLSETEAIALNLQLEAPFFPVRFCEVKTEIGRPRGIGHVTLGNGDVTGGGRVGM